MTRHPGTLVLTKAAAHSALGLPTSLGLKKRRISQSRLGIHHTTSIIVEETCKHFLDIKGSLTLGDTFMMAGA